MTSGTRGFSCYFLAVSSIVHIDVGLIENVLASCRGPSHLKREKKMLFQHEINKNLLSSALSVRTAHF